MLTFSYLGKTQVAFGNAEILKIKYDLEEIQNFLLEVSNTSDSLIQVDWRINRPEALADFVRVEIHDTNLGWAPYIGSGCGKDKPNEVPAQESVWFSIDVRLLADISEENIHWLDSISIELLSFPDCNAIYDKANFTQVDPTNTKLVRSDNFDLYPNPVDEMLYVDFIPTIVKDYEIFNLQGKLMQKGKMSDRISLQFQDAGVYMLLIKSKDRVSIARFVKK